MVEGFSQQLKNLKTIGRTTSKLVVFCIIIIWEVKANVTTKGNRSS